MRHAPLRGRRTLSMLEAAEARVSDMDEVDRKSSFGTPDSLQHLAGLIAIVLDTAIETRDWRCVADALVYVRQIEDKLPEAPDASQT
jgi:hypothetical protein